jgi:ribosome-associated protein
MARKSKGFQWIREDQDQAELFESKDRLERSPLRRETRALEKLSMRLAALTPGQRRALPLDAALRDQIDVLANCKADGSRARQLRAVTGLLRDADRGPLMAMLDDDPVEVPFDPRVEAWVGLLRDEGDVGLQALIEAHPTADRGHLRDLMREARTGGTRGARGEWRLLEAVADLTGLGGE